MKLRCNVLLPVGRVDPDGAFEYNIPSVKNEHYVDLVAVRLMDEDGKVVGDVCVTLDRRPNRKNRLVIRPA